MAYTCELGPGQRLYLDNVGGQTTVTMLSGNAGQQQQSSSQFTTGVWTAPPEMFVTPQGFVIKLTTAQGVQHLQVQGTQFGWITGNPLLDQAQQVPMSTVSSTSQTVQPMQPMQPMKMGNMQMNMNPMQMRMGNMAMQIGTSSNDAENNAAVQPQFCSQCGTPVKSSDRFCANCGHQLKT